jgi:hypothetical protein
MNQTTNTVLLISPTSFGFNPETASSNIFQHDIEQERDVTQYNAEREWEQVCALLVKEKINVIAVMDTTTPKKPDALFPNNWITTHEDGKIILYPLMAENRRAEKRTDIVEQMKKKYLVTDIIDLSYFEKQNKFLEGTGSMVFDRENKIIYACLSPRTHSEPLMHVAKILGYEVITFHAFDHKVPVYHTNVFMSVGRKWVAICMDAIPDENERERLTRSFAKTGKEIIHLSQTQMDAFAGNMLELQTLDGETKIIMSKTTLSSLSEMQIHAFTVFGDICSADVSTIEQVGGGGIRCLLAEIFLKKI